MSEQLDIKKILDNKGISMDEANEMFNQMKPDNTLASALVGEWVAPTEEEKEQHRKSEGV